MGWTPQQIDAARARVGANDAARAVRDFWISKHDRTVLETPPFYAPDQWIHVREVMEGEAQ